MKRILSAILLVGTGSALCALDSVYPLTENSFDNPEFVERFVGSYGFDMNINPQITADEAELFKTVAPSMERNRTAAIRQIEQFITTQSQDADADPYSPALDYTLGSLYLQNGGPPAGRASLSDGDQKIPEFLPGLSESWSDLCAERGV